MMQDIDDQIFQFLKGGPIETKGQLKFQES